MRPQEQQVTPRQGQVYPAYIESTVGGISQQGVSVVATESGLANGKTTATAALNADGSYLPAQHLLGYSSDRTSAEVHQPPESNAISDKESQYMAQSSQKSPASS